MRPIVCRGHTRPLTRVKYNRDGDLLFSAGKDKNLKVWYSHNGELLGSYEGHNGVVWDIDISFDSNMLLSGAADNSATLWDVETGTKLFSWTTNSPVRCVEFAMGDEMALLVTDSAMGYPCTICVVEIKDDVQQIPAEPKSLILLEGISKVTAARWGPLNKHIYTGHEDGSLSMWEPMTGERVKHLKAHTKPITDLQFSYDKTYFITSSKDSTARLYDTKLNLLKTYITPRPANSAAIHPLKEHVIVGGGQEASQVTTTSNKEGAFEARFFHKILEQEIGRVKGHFGPINTIAISPDGKGFTTGGEDGYIRIQHFDPDYFRFKIDPSEEH
ncbi:eukaryotic translation initiation factor 3 subunit I-like protein [Paraphysoderma sedebokerense]|nr:eukaryotic translation initiation factor 3 subunit I-like protein [Paraphysoderma sedebokerense]